VPIYSTLDMSCLSCWMGERSSRAWSTRIRL
jgi:hypothetical protein